VTYVDGKMTVLCNATNGILNTVIPDPLGGRGGITLDKGEYFDIERVLSKSKIRKLLPELEKMEANGHIAWSLKGTKPVNKFVPKRKFDVPIHGTVMAPTNIFDDKLNALLEKDAKQDEKTMPGDMKRRENVSFVGEEKPSYDEDNYKNRIEELSIKNKELEEKLSGLESDNYGTDSETEACLPVDEDKKEDEVESLGFAGEDETDEGSKQDIEDDDFNSVLNLAKK